MIELLEWLLELEDIRLGHDAPLVLTWGRHPPAWMLFCFAVAVVTAVALIYRRESTSLARRCVLGTIRCGTIAIVVAVLCRPTLVLLRNRVDPSYVALALDTSQSMGTRDRYEDAALAGAIARGANVADAESLHRHSRLDLVKTALTRENGASLARLLERNELQVCTFAGSVEPRAVAARAAPAAKRKGAREDSRTSEMGDSRTSGAARTADPTSALTDVIAGTVADGKRTDLAGAITHVLEKTQGRHLAAIVLATDGQTTEPTSLTDALELARGRKIPLFPIRIGSTHRPRDVSVGPLRADASVFVNDLLAVQARVSASGLVGPTPVTVRLIDERTSAAAASQEVMLDPAEPATTVELLTKPTHSGSTRFRVEIPPIPGERTVDNNADHVEVAIIDDRLRVLYIDAYPRYEYRYLKNALLREETMEVSVLLLEADEPFVQEGTYPIRRFPETPEELNRYDVVLFGDVDPRGGWLTSAQMTMLLDFVGNEGGGFGLIAGERSAPRRFLGTPLEKLIPVRIDPEFLGHYDEPLSVGFRPRLTPEGLRSRLFGRQPSSESRPSGSGHEFDSLPELYWFARTLGPKPGVTVLARHPTVQTPGDSLAGPQFMPIIAVGRYGAGRIFFQATDDTWRWRRQTGELLHDTYWVQVARRLMRHDRVAQNRRFVIHTDRKTYDYGAPVHAQVEILDMQLLVGLGDRLELVISEPSAPSRQPSPDSQGQSEIRNPQSAIPFPAHRLGPDSNVYEGTVIPARPGGFLIGPGRELKPRRDPEGADVPPRGSERTVSVSIRVEPPRL
ncbi:MAG: hypothetical protein ACYTFA_02085, partial [Planctomycetota bacterium]